MQMQINVVHDFSQLDAVVEKLFRVFSQLMASTGHPIQDNAPATPVAMLNPAARRATVRDAVDASHGATRDPNPKLDEAAMAEKAAAVNSPAPVEKRGRGRPKKEKAEKVEAAMPAREIADNQPAPGTEATHHATAPKHTAAVPGFDDDAPAADTPPTPDEISAFKELALKLVAVPNMGDALYLDIRAKHGNPKVADMGRKTFDAMKRDVAAAIEDPTGFAKTLAKAA